MVIITPTQTAMLLFPGVKAAISKFMVCVAPLCTQNVGEINLQELLKI